MPDQRFVKLSEGRGVGRRTFRQVLLATTEAVHANWRQLAAEAAIVSPSHHHKACCYAAFMMGRLHTPSSRSRRHVSAAARTLSTWRSREAMLRRPEAAPVSALFKAAVTSALASSALAMLGPHLSKWPARPFLSPDCT